MTNPEMKASGGIATLGVILGGIGGASFLLEPITVPFWFILASFVLPTGEMLAWLRGWIPESPGGAKER